MVVWSSIILLAYYINKDYDDSEHIERQLHKANFLKNVKFHGDILYIENLGWKYRGLVSICMDLNDFEVDSSKIIEGNSFFALDDILVGITYKSYSYNLNNRSMKMNEVSLNKNWNGKLMLYSSAGDSIDITSDFVGIGNSKNTQFCRDFVE